MYKKLICKILSNVVPLGDIGEGVPCLRCGEKTIKVFWPPRRPPVLSGYQPHSVPNAGEGTPPVKP